MSQVLMPSVLFLTRSVSFPNGMAATQRVHLLARGLLELGIDVSVLCTQVTERPPLIKNNEKIGLYNGIHFEYTTGTTIRSNNFFVRRWHELQGILVALLRLIQLKRSHKACCVYYYGNILAKQPAQWLFFVAIRLLKIPLLVDVCERPWTINNRIQIKKIFSPLGGADGAVVISEFLRKWAEQEKAMIKQNIAILEVPILVNVDEQPVTGYCNEFHNVLFAGSPDYDQTLQFILDAMKIVWVDHPFCKLVVTGCDPDTPAGRTMKKTLQMHNLDGKVELTGYLSRNELMLRYSKATALLIPLFNDIRSEARFPTKIGEYLASGRPIVTNQVGEIARYFQDRVDAYICNPGDPTNYADKIMEVINNYEAAIEVGLAGRKIAEKNFHYSIHSHHLAGFIETIISKADTYRGYSSSGNSSCVE